MFLPDRGNKDYKRGFEDGLKRCAAILKRSEELLRLKHNALDAEKEAMSRTIRQCLEQGESIIRVNLERREAQLKVGLDALAKQKAEWEETTSKFVVEQLKSFLEGR